MALWGKTIQLGGLAVLFLRVATLGAQATSAGPQPATTGIENTPQAVLGNQSNSTPLDVTQPGPAVPGVEGVVNRRGTEKQTPIYTLRTTVRRVAVDVVVTDSKGHPVKGFTREDFKVFEDGVAQKVIAMDAHNLSVTPTATLADSVKLPPNTFANLVRAPEGSPVVVILYDMLNTPTSAMPYAHQAIVKFIKSQKQGSRIAVFALGSRLRMLQGFTDDETRLLNALNSKKAGTQQSSLLLTADGPGGGNTDALAAADPVTDIAASLAALTSLETSEEVLMQQQRLEATEDAFAEIARFVSTLPGRKNLIWLSGSFPGNALPNADPAAQGTNNEFGNTYQMGEKIKETNDLLNLNHVSVYPVDVRGLQVNSVYSAATNKGPGQRPPPVVTGVNEAAEHSTMDEIAESTGGRAFYNTNGLEEAMRTAMNEGATYYTLTYAPTKSQYDGTARKIKVVLGKPGFELSYRRTYFADDPKHPLDAPAVLDAAGQPRSIFLDADMQHGSPISSELFFEASVTPVGAVVAATDKEMAQLSQFMATKTRAKKEASSPGPAARPVQVQHYRVDYAILGRQLDLPVAEDGRYKTDMTFALAAYSPDSLIVNGLEVSVKNQIPEAQYQKIRTQGYHAKLDFVAPVQASALRVAVRDGIGSKVGSIEIPLPVTPAPVAAAK